MNNDKLTVGLSADTLKGQDDATTSRSATSRLRQRLMAPLTLALLMIGLTTAVGGTSASASGAPGAATTSLSCGSTGMYEDTTIYAQAGYSSQPVAKRLYVKDLTTGAATWAAWNSGAVPSSNRFIGWAYPPANHVYQMYVQYAWYSGGSWTYAGHWVTSYVHRLLYGDYNYTSYCYEY